MPDTKSPGQRAAVKALKPFAALAAEIEQADEKWRDDRTTLLSIGIAYITTADLRLAAKTLAKLARESAP